jgi:hypothetical protein
MKLKIILMLLIVLALAALASAQTKISGTVLCTKEGYTVYTLQVGDSPNHSFNMDQSKCKWTKPLDIGGAQAKEFVNTGFGEVSGNRLNDYGYSVVTMTTGDKCYARFPWRTITLKDGVAESDEGKWTFVGGTGKLKGIKGKGTFTEKNGPESSTIEVEGEYELPK